MPNKNFESLKYKRGKQVLVQWIGSTQVKATWESFKIVPKDISLLSLEDKAKLC